MTMFPSVTAGGAFESTAVQDAIKALAMQAVDARLAALEYDSGMRNITSLAAGVGTGNLRFRVKNGWAALYLSDVKFPTAAPELFASAGPLAPWAPTAAMGVANGTALNVSSQATLRISVFSNGRAAIYGAPVDAAVNGHVEWPFDRTPPADPIGDPA